MPALRPDSPHAKRNAYQREQRRRQQQLRRQTDEVREKHNAYQREYSQREHVKARKATPEYKAARAAYQREWLKKCTPEQAAARRAKSAEWKKTHPELMRQYRRAFEKRQREAMARTRRLLQPGILENSAPSPERDMLLRLNALVPRTPYREDIIAEAALLVIEGAEIEAAVTAARTSMRRFATAHWQHIPMQDMHTI